MTVTLPAHMSYSQKGSLARCSGAYYLERGLHVPQRPGWAQIAGNAIHEATAWWDAAVLDGQREDDLDELFNSWFDAQIEKVEEREPDFPRETWRASGRATKANPNKEDEAFWRQEGPAQLRRWVNWRLNSGWEIAMLPDPTTGELIPGIECEFEFYAGSVKVIGFIDRVFARDDDLMVVDLKTGSYTPDDEGQLATYRGGLEEFYGVTPKWGTYWMGRTGSTVTPYDLDNWTAQRLAYEYEHARRQQLAGDFRYKVSRMCGSCSVRDYCAAVGGDLAYTVPQPWEQVELPVISDPSTRSYDVTPEEEGDTE